MFTLRWSASIVVILVSFGSAQAQEPTVSWDGMQGAVPSSPAPGKITASGTFTLPAGYSLEKVKFKYKLSTSTNWIEVDANTNVNVNPKAWSKTVEGLAPGVYDVHVVLMTRKLVNNENVFYSIATDSRQVTVLGQEDDG